MLTLFIIALSLSTYTTKAASPLTYKEITVDLKGDLEYYLNSIGDPFTVGNLVRWGFHTCVTGCDGCINLENPANAGLTPTYNATIGLYNDPSPPSGIQWKKKINNYADFWSITATVGNMIAIPNGSYVPQFQFWTGRKACSTSPNQTLLAPFPDATKGLSAQSEMFGEIFNLTQPQYIALIGGHTLGFAHSTASGFDTLPWTSTPTILNNEFYMLIKNIVWKQLAAQENGLYEWEASGFFMFNSDVCIYKNLLQMNSTDGQSTCDYSSCPVRDETLDQINAYINNQTMWLDDYAVAWNIMEVAGVDVSTLTQILPQ
eukprot:485736_1